ncbi:MAG: tRNA (adenosine(37)-N6)-threonylcarbamoyltransferase complex ATPase subunit type 1 TsaE [Verrucomicrobia bacterium]|nr:MAG: tRNA (adenosine(37)-N6)-threonylcarbamoyltransferase complex ATPase subunit type 1 TsaE [Verrucomicrobiota bacterium]
MNILDDLKKGIFSSTPQTTISIAKDLASAIPIDHTLALHGDLGSGKTTFVKGLARAWGINEEITSPTFNIYTIYKGHRNLIHLDAYRLSDESEVENLFLEEFLLSPFCLAIEWPEKIPSFLQPTSWHLYFEIQPNQSHSIKLEIPN